MLYRASGALDIGPRIVLPPSIYNRHYDQEMPMQHQKGFIVEVKFLTD